MTAVEGTTDCDHDCACACHLLLGASQDTCNRGEEGGCCPNACLVCDGEALFEDIATQEGSA